MCILKGKRKWGKITIGNGFILGVKLLCVAGKLYFLFMQHMWKVIHGWAK